jgi:hypothetical protein
MSETDDDVEEEVRSILAELSEEERELLSRVLDVERDKLHMKVPHGVNDELSEVIEQTIE